MSTLNEVSMVVSDEDADVARLKGKYAAMVVCWLLGNGCLFSWNSMLTIEDYYGYLFPKYHSSRVLTLVYQPFALVTISILTYWEAKINTRKRNLFGYLLFFICSLFVLILDLATSGKGGLGPFIGICVISGGALTSILRLITKGAFENSKNGLRKGALLFFAISAFFELLCVILYAFTFPKLPIVKHFRAKAALEGSKTVSADLAAAGIHRVANEAEGKTTEVGRLSNKELLLQNVDYAIGLFLIYALTLSIFPGFLSEDTGSHSLGTWYALVLIAAYNVFDLVGRYIPLIKCIKLESRKWLMVSILARILLVPAFYFTAKYGNQGWMILLTSFLGLTNGYLTVCLLTTAPKGYKGPEQNALGNLLVMFLLGGIFAGVTLDWLWLIGKGW
ncbi:equilibrative nucleotide transporter 3-like isoform X1 [Cucumis melo var. makuwa]|uniref:Equilibrative nucleotide transporter 3-like isoform X1 n=1 Tax=Cucumis melo var. makuwa TaxID=1194695 RepID=A0A5D3CPK3_CUCMM|nr:equilibrative nucleotide transporter 3-like isoform X1 [Cucumis melo var. makuwa]